MADHTAEIYEITRDALVEKRRHGEAFILVDVLTHENFTHIHLPGAINLPLDTLRELAPLVLGFDDEIVVYCASFSCQASRRAARQLMDLGFTNVLDYTGGIQDWTDGDLPLIHHDQQAGQ